MDCFVFRRDGFPTQPKEQSLSVGPGLRLEDEGPEGALGPPPSIGNESRSCVSCALLPREPESNGGFWALPLREGVIPDISRLYVSHVSSQIKKKVEKTKPRATLAQVYGSHAVCTHTHHLLRVEPTACIEKKKNSLPNTA